jgi:hypothetical protein
MADISQDGVWPAQGHDASTVTALVAPEEATPSTKISTKTAPKPAAGHHIPWWHGTRRIRFVTGGRILPGWAREFDSGQRMEPEAVRGAKRCPGTGRTQGSYSPAGRPVCCRVLLVPVEAHSGSPRVPGGCARRLAFPVSCNLYCVLCKGLTAAAAAAAAVQAAGRDPDARPAGTRTGVVTDRAGVAHGA